MKRLTLIIVAFLFCLQASAQVQAPCSGNANYRQFDFWIGEWDVYGPNGGKAGNSKIELILDSCIILENWSDLAGYSGKSFSRWNAAEKKWQQTWVDNKGGNIEFSEGRFEGDKMIFETSDLAQAKGGSAIQRMTFSVQAPGKVRQHGQQSTDGGKTWTTSYDLEYRRKK